MRDTQKGNETDCPNCALLFHCSDTYSLRSKGNLFLGLPFSVVPLLVFRFWYSWYFLLPIGVRWGGPHLC